MFSLKKWCRFDVADTEQEKRLNALGRFVKPGVVGGFMNTRCKIERLVKFDVLRQTMVHFFGHHAAGQRTFL